MRFGDVKTRSRSRRGVSQLLCVSYVYSHKEKDPLPAPNRS